MTDPVEFRIGHGYDIHRLRDGGKLVLGGVVVAEGLSVVAHSDGDVVIHAIVDALLGASGGGDIGEHFPESDPNWKDAKSSMFLEKIVQDVTKSGWRILNCDVTLLAERPRLGPLKKEIAGNLRRLLRCDVNVKAGTNEGLDSIGRGEAIAAHAVVMLAKGD